MTQSQRHLCLIILCATAVRVVYFFQFQDNPFFDYVPRSWDQEIYYEGGLAFARGDYLAIAPDMDNHFSPVYQYFLGILFLVFGGNPEVAWIAQFLLGVFSTILVYSIACQFFSRTAGLISALLFTFYAPNWLYEGSLYRASLIVFLELATVRLMLAVKNRPKPFLLISSALVLGLFMQVRSNNLLIFPVIIYYLWQQIDVGKNKWLLMGGYMLLVALVCTPALFWVNEVRGQWGLYDKSGPENLLLSNTLDHSVRRYEHNATYQEVLESIPLETVPVFKYILETIRDHPLEFLVLYLKKIYFYFNNFEIPVTVNFYLSQEFSPILGWGIPFVVVGAMGLCGGVLLWRRKGWTPLHSFFLYAILIFIPFLVLSRYRLYAIPFLCMFSGYYLVAITEWSIEKKWKAVTLSLLCVMGLGLLFKTNSLPEGNIRINDLANMGSAYLNNDQLEDDFKSYNYFRRAHELSQSLETKLQQPKIVRRLFHDYQFFKAKRFIQEGDGEKALDSLERALTYDYSVSNSHYVYAKELFKMKILGGALREALEAIEIRPDYRDAHLLLGSIYSKLPYPPYWLIFHLEEVRNQSQSTEYETVSKTLYQIRSQLGLPELDKTYSWSEEKEQIINLLSPGLAPIREEFFGPVISQVVDRLTPQEKLSYMIMLYQRLMFSDVRRADIHYQLGLLYWKKENRLSAAVHHLEKAWDIGRQSPYLPKLIELHTASLTYDKSG